MQSEAGKGSSRRKNDDAVKYAENWERIFGKKSKDSSEAKEKDK